MTTPSLPDALRACIEAANMVFGTADEPMATGAAYRCAALIRQHRPALEQSLRSLADENQALLREREWWPITQGGDLPNVGEWVNVLTDTHARSRPDLLFLSPDKPRYAVIPAQLRYVDDGWPMWQRWELASGAPCALIEGDTHWMPLPARPNGANGDVETLRVEQPTGDSP